MLMTRFARTAAVVLMLAGVLWASPVAAEDGPDCDPKQRACMSETARATRNTSTTTTTEPPAIRTIREGQTVTFTTPNPRNRQELYCSPATTVYTTTTVYVDGVPFSTTTSRTRHATALFLPPGTERSSDETFTCGTGKRRGVWGPCVGPYTVESGTGDSRVEVAGSRRLRVVTDASDNLDDTGSVDIPYYLHGTRTKVSAQSNDQPDVTTTEECTLKEAVRVEVRLARRPGMTDAVARHAPALSYLNSPATVTWTCTQEIIDEGVQCELDTVVSRTRTPTFPTPRGCTIIVTVAKNGKGFGSTACLTSNQVAAYEDQIRSTHPDEGGIDVSSLPKCPDSTAPADMNALPTDSSDRQRCVAKN